MTTDELLRSGLLELYVADACTAEERVIVERAAQEDARVRRELEEIGAAVEHYATAHAIAPSSSVREKLIEWTEREAAAEQELASSLQRSATHEAAPSTTHAKVRGRLSPVAYLSAASIGLIIGLLPSAYMYFERTDLVHQRDAARLQLADAKRAQSVIAHRATQLQWSLDKVADERFKHVHLPAVDKQDLASATVFWNPETKEVLIDARNLPVLSNEQSYQLWAIVGGQPVDLGVLPSTDADAALRSMKPIDKPAMFAITVEPRGGSATPTLTAMKVAGKV